jgi:hypothetical protein
VRSLLCALLLGLLASPSGADQVACAPRQPYSPDEFVQQLLRVADETDPQAVLRDFDQVFGVELALHTRVLVSALLDPPARNNVLRFVRLGDPWYPLSFGHPADYDCVGFELIDRLLRADGWQGGRTAGAAGAPAEVWVYQKGRTQFWAEPRDVKGAAGSARTCAASILVTFR